MKRMVLFALFAIFASAAVACGGVDDADESESTTETSHLYRARLDPTPPPTDPFAHCTRLYDSCMTQGGCTLDPFEGGWGTCPSGVWDDCYHQQLMCILES